MPDEEYEFWIDRYVEENHSPETRIHYQGNDYLSMVYEGEITDSTSPEDSSIVLYITHERDCGYDFYIPTSEEIRGYQKYGYDPSRTCFARLRRFITEAYLDEKTLEDMSAGMFRAFLKDAEDLEHFRGCSMDEVEEETEETFSEMVQEITGNNNADSIMSYHEDFTAGFTDEAKQELKEILEECVETAPQTWYLGHSIKEVREQNLETNYE